VARETKPYDPSIATATVNNFERKSSCRLFLSRVKLCRTVLIHYSNEEIGGEL